MSEPQPVLISLLKLPPELHPILRLRELFLIVQERLDQVSLALSATQPGGGLALKFDDIIMPLRNDAAELVADFAACLAHMILSSQYMAGYVNSFPINSTGCDVSRALNDLQFTISMEADSWEKERKGMEEFASATLSGLENLRERLGHSKSRKESSALNKENSHTAKELIQAIQEATSILRHYVQFYRRLAEHYQNPESFTEHSPSLDEVTIVRESWVTFSEDLMSFKANATLPRIGSDLRSGWNSIDIILANRIHGTERKWTLRGKAKKTPLKLPQTPLAAGGSGQTSSKPNCPPKRSSLKSFCRRPFQFIFKKQAC